MTNFKLQPGDWIPTSEVPVDKRQKVIDAFVDAGASYDDRDNFLYFFPKWENVGWDGNILDMWNDVCKIVDVKRRVTLEQILGDNCEMTDCNRKGVPGNENIVNGKVVCDECCAKGSVLTVEVPKEPTPEMINAMFDAMRKLEDEEYPGNMAKYSVNDMLAHVWIAGVNAAKVGSDD